MRNVMAFVMVAGMMGGLAGCWGDVHPPPNEGTPSGGGTTTGTGSNSGGGGGSGTGGSGGSGTEGGTSPFCTVENMAGTWQLANDGAQGVTGIWTFTNAATWDGRIFYETTNGVFEEQEATGTFTTDGEFVTLTVQEWTCPCVASAIVLQCAVANGGLFFKTPGAANPVLWVPDNAALPSNPVEGCFGHCGAGGAFVAHPLTSQ